MYRLPRKRSAQKKSRNPAAATASEADRKGKASRVNLQKTRWNKPPVKFWEASGECGKLSKRPVQAGRQESANTNRASQKSKQGPRHQNAAPTGAAFLRLA